MALYMIKDGVFPKYIYHALQSDRDVYGFDRTYRTSLRNVPANVIVRVPMDSEGNIDPEVEKRIATRYSQVQAMRR